MGIILQLAAGFFSGIVSGMGIGGGIILIPVLTMLLGFEQKTAQGMNLLYFIPTAAVALCVHFKNKNVDVKTAWPIAAFGAAASVAGALSAASIPSSVLSKIFALLIIGIGCNEIILAIKAEK